jgi:hypothetical protein
MENQDRASIGNKAGDQPHGRADVEAEPGRPAPRIQPERDGREGSQQTKYGREGRLQRPTVRLA